MRTWIGAAAMAFGAVLWAAPPAPAAEVSGTVRYTGSEGPVSAQRPIQVALLTGLGPAVAQTQMTTNPGSFVLDVPPGEYFLGVILVQRLDGVPRVGEPLQLFDRRFDLASADRLEVPAEGVGGLSIELDDSGRVSGIAGTVTYTGAAGPVTPERPLIVALLDDPDLTRALQQVEVAANGGRFDLVTLDTGTYYLVAFLDVNGSGMREEPEPLTIHAGRRDPPGDPVTASTDPAAVAIVFGDDPSPTPTQAAATPTDTPPPLTATPATPVPACVGDCNGDGAVLVNELVTGVNVALGNLGLAACASLDADGNAAVAVNELIRAVGNALAGC